MIIPDYLIIDEIRRRKEQSKDHEPIPLPVPSYDIPEDSVEYPRRKRPEPKKPKNNGVIILDIHGNLHV